MGRYVASQNDDDEEELDEGEDAWESGEDSTEICPHCGEEIYDDVVQCPHCGKYLSEEDTPSQPKPLWIWVGTILALLVGALMCFQF